MQSYRNFEHGQMMLPGIGHTNETDLPPPVPGKRETSQNAAESVAPFTPRQRARIFDFVARQGSRGATRDEIAAALELPSNSVTPRVLELIRKGHLQETDRRRPTRYGRAAVVMVAILEGARNEV